jgi:hypothetical protein
VKKKQGKEKGKERNSKETKQPTNNKETYHANTSQWQLSIHVGNQSLETPNCEKTKKK